MWKLIGCVLIIAALVLGVTVLIGYASTTGDEAAGVAWFMGSGFGTLCAGAMCLFFGIAFVGWGVRYEDK